MDRLSLIDQALHKVAVIGLPPLNMQGALIVDPGRAPFRVNAKMIAGHLAARLHGVPILRKRLVQDPLRMGDLRLVDDARFDVWNHLTFATLPPPGDMRALTRHLGHFSAQDLDFDRPLWRFEIIDGLRDGRVAIAQKLSHAMMDGVAAVRMMQGLYDEKPRRPSRYRARAWSPEPQPTPLQLLGEATRESAERFGIRSARVAGKLLGLAAQSVTAAIGERLRAGTGSPGARSEPALKVRPTSLNTTISTNQRYVAFANLELEPLKALSRALGCKLNDLCLLLVSEALIAYFAGIGEAIDFDLVSAMPLNMRQASDKEFGNAIAVSRINLHNTIPGLRERLGAIQADSTRIKDATRGSGGGDASVLPEVAAVIPPFAIDLLGYALKVAQPWEKLPLAANIIFSNVPGPREELYFAGMPIEVQIPIIPLFHPGALTIGGLSNGNQFCFGFHACAKVVREEHMQYLVDGLDNAFRQLLRGLRPATSRKRAAGASADVRAR